MPGRVTDPDLGACKNVLAYRSEEELRQKLQQAAVALQDIVKAVDVANGITTALRHGTYSNNPSKRFSKPLYRSHKV